VGVRGRKPTPTAKKILRGNPGKRALPKNEPKPKTGILAPPDWMMDEAKQEWARVAPELIRTCGLAKIDRAILSAYCQVWARFVEGERTENPVKAATIAQLRALASSLGLDPTSRTRMQSPESGDENDFDDFDDPTPALGTAVCAGRA
jgi:phage terminase small subunit